MKKLVLGVAAVSLSWSAFSAPVDPKKAASQGISEFGFNLLKAVDASKSSEPLAISPMSLGEALGLVTQGAEDKTLKELEQLLLSPDARKAGGNGKSLAAGIAALRTDLLKYSKASNGAFTYTSANALWGNSNPNIGFAFKAPFLKTAEELFGAKPTAEDFRSRATVDHINQWVDKNTNHKISKLITDLGPDDVAVLLNAIYAKGKFAAHFPSATEGDYENRAGAKQKASFLTRRGDTHFYEDKNVQVLSLEIGEKPYTSKATHGQIALDIIVPVKGTIDDVIKDIDAETYADYVAKLKTEEVELTLPAGKVEQKEAFKLKPVLTEKPFLLTTAFDEERARFGLLGSTKKEENLYISDVLTKAFYEVTPFGFEAAAATAVIVARAATAIIDPKFKTVKIDGPSLHIIRHVPTGTPLFITVQDNPVVYDEKRLVEFVEEGHKTNNFFSAETAAGTIGPTYDDASKGLVVGLTNSKGKLVKVFKKLE